MMKEQLNPKGFTPALGAYSHGTKVNVGTAEFIFVTGQLAMDKDGNAVAPKDITRQTEFIFENIKTILREGGATLDDVVKVVVYLTDINDFKEFSAVRNKYFVNSRPASTLLEASRLVKEGCAVEIDVISVRACKDKAP